VYGGVFILKRYIKSILKDSECGNFIVQSSDDKFSVKNIVLGPELVMESTGEKKQKPVNLQPDRIIGRAVLITKGGAVKPNIDSEKSKPNDGVSLYKVENFEIIELSHVTNSVPKDFSTYFNFFFKLH